MASQRFIELLTKELTGDILPEEDKELQSLLKTDKLSRQEYELLRNYWIRKETSHIDVHSAFEKIIDKIKIQEEESGILSEFSLNAPVKKKINFLRSWRSVAAIFILVIISSGVYRYFSLPSS